MERYIGYIFLNVIIFMHTNIMIVDNLDSDAPNFQKVGHFYGIYMAKIIWMCVCFSVHTTHNATIRIWDTNMNVIHI